MAAKLEHEFNFGLCGLQGLYGQIILPAKQGDDERDARSKTEQRRNDRFAGTGYFVKEAYDPGKIPTPVPVF